MYASLGQERRHRWRISDMAAHCRGRARPLCRTGHGPALAPGGEPWPTSTASVKRQRAVAPAPSRAATCRGPWCDA